MRAQTMPRQKDGFKWRKLRRFLNTSTLGDFYLLIVHIICCFIGGIPHAILIINGVGGSAKTTTSRFLQMLIDPSVTDTLALPASREDLVLQLNSTYFAVYDNLKSIPDNYVDIFCQSSTGGYFSKRKLYTDDELVPISFKRCIVLNGIQAITEQSDLLDRSILITLKRITDDKRETESELYSEFSKEVPAFLDFVFNVISKAKALHRSLKIHLPRMGDYAKWGYAIAEVIGIGGDNYLEIYNNNQLSISKELLYNNPTAKAVMDFMASKKVHKSSVDNMWKTLEQNAIVTGVNIHAKEWAKSASAFSRQLNLVKVNLEQQGVYFDIRNIGNNKEIRLENKNITSATQD
jgi:hypothetical protein